MLGLGWRATTPLDPEIQAEYEAAYSHPETVRAMLGYYRAAARPRVAALLGGRKPAGPPRVHADRMLVLWGARDPVLPISVGESVVRDLGPECVMVTVPGAGHFVIEEAPDVVADVLVDFLGDAPAGARTAAPPEGPEHHRVEQEEPPPASVVESATVGLVPVGGGPDGAPARPAPAKKSPARKAAAKQTPAKRVPVKQVPVKQAPAKQVPAKKAPRAPRAGGPEVPPSPGTA
jgi:hypothetical protein